MDPFAGDNPLYMCSLCSNVFMTEVEAEEHVCPNVPNATNTIIVEELQIQEGIPTAAITETSTPASVDSVPSTSKLLPSPNECVQPIINTQKKKDIFQTLARNVNEEDETIDSKSGWTVEATHSLIKVYKEVMGNKEFTWSMVSEKMQTIGYKVTPLLCENRWNAIRRKYHRVVDYLSRGEANSTMASFPYLIPLSDIIPVKGRRSKKEVKSNDEECKLPKKLSDWTREEENTFLAILKSKMIEFSAAENKPTMDVVWSDITKDMAYHGVHFSTRDCIKKWIGLLKKYRSVESDPQPEVCQGGFENFYIVMEIIQWFPPDYLVWLQDTSVFGGKFTKGVDQFAPVWTDDAVTKMLQELDKRKSFYNAFSKISLWKDICESLRKDGYSYHYIQVHSKWKVLKRKYLSRAGLYDVPYLDLFLKIYNFIESGEAEELPKAPKASTPYQKSARTGVPWTTEATKAFLELLYERKEIFAAVGVVMRVFEKVSQLLCEKGFHFDAEQCSGKWKSIKKRYRAEILQGQVGPREKDPLPRQDIIKELLNIREKYKSQPSMRKNWVTAANCEEMEDEDLDSGAAETVSQNLTESIQKSDTHGFPWSTNATKTLLELLYERKETLASVKGIMSLFKELSDVMIERGYPFNAEQCCNKWKTIKRKYKHEVLLGEVVSKHWGLRLPCKEIVQELYNIRENYKAMDLPFTKNNSATTVKCDGMVDEYSDSDGGSHTSDGEPLEDEDFQKCGGLPWSKNATKAYLDLLYERRKKFATARVLMPIYKEVSRSLCEKGFPFDAEQCCNKWKTIKRRYRQEILSNQTNPDAQYPGLPYKDLIKKLYDLRENAQSVSDDDVMINTTSSEMTINEHSQTQPPEQFTSEGNDLSMAIDAACHNELSPGDESEEKDISKSSTSGLTWSNNATRAFLKLLYDRKETFASERMVKRFYKDISQGMCEQGFTFDADQCCNKWKSIKRRYRQGLALEREGKRNHLRLPCQDLVKELFDLREYTKFLVPEKKNWVSTARYVASPEECSDSGSEEEHSAGEGQVTEEARKYSSWSHEAVMNLIKVYKDVFLKVKKESYNGRMFWKTVHLQMIKDGYNQSQYSCKRKLHKVCGQYKKKSEKDDGQHSEIRKWPYAEAVRDLLILKKKYDKRNPLCPSVGSGPYAQQIEENDIEQQITKRKGNLVWEKDATVVFMELYKERREKFLNKLMYKKKDLWEEISQALHKIGYHYTALNCELKYRSLLHGYRKTVRHNALPGTVKRTCPFYSDFKELVPYTPVNSKEQKELFKSLKRKSKALEVENRKKMEAEREELEAARKIKMEEMRKTLEEERKKWEQEKLTDVLKAAIPVKMITLPAVHNDDSSSSVLETYSVVMDEDDLENGGLDIQPGMDELGSESQISDVDDSVIDSGKDDDDDDVDYALSDLDDDDDGADAFNDNASAASLLSVEGSEYSDMFAHKEQDPSFSQNKSTTFEESSTCEKTLANITPSSNLSSPPLKKQKTSAQSKIYSPSSEHSSSSFLNKSSSSQKSSSVSPNQAVGEMFSLLQGYTEKQEHRDRERMDRMEKMQKTIFDVMKTISVHMETKQD